MESKACSLGEYYRERAAEYDEVYLKPERQADLARLRTLLPPLVAGKHVLEIAAGTGFWTAVQATSAASVTATDRSAEMVAIAAQRDYGPADVRLLTADAYQLGAVPGEFDLVFCGFWWSRIRRADISRFLAGLRARVAPGTGLVLLDNRCVPGSSQPPSRDQLTAGLAGAATELAWTELASFWLASCVLC